MSRDKQIEEMAKVLGGLSCTNRCVNCKHFYNKYDDVGCVDMNFAEKLYSKGYRKASDVAREIFEKADKIFMSTCLSIEAYKAWCDLKKKYESEGAEDDL